MTISTPRTQAQLDAILRSGDPVADVDLGAPRLTAALDEMAHAIRLQAGVRPARRRRTRARRVLLIAVLALGVAVGGAAAAGWFINAHTGRFPHHAWEVTAGGPGEALNIAGTNFRQVAARVTADIRFPADYARWRNWVLRTVSPDAQTCPGASTRNCISTVSTGALRGWTAMAAFCAWTVDWRQSLRAGRTAQASADARAIAAALGWSAVRAEDPRLFGWMTPYLPAVATGNRGRVDTLLASGIYGNHCWSADPAFARRIDGLGDPGRAYLTFLDRGRS